MHPCKAAAVIAFLVVSTVSQRLDKPPLQQDLNNLKQGFLSNLTPVESTRTAYKTGYIPADCKAIVQREKFNVADIKTWNVKYDDVSLLTVALLSFTSLLTAVVLYTVGCLLSSEEQRDT